METKRLFIGTFIDPTIFDDVYGKLQEDFSPVISGKWTEQHNLHFTYKFLGNVDVEKIDDIKRALSKICREYKSDLSIKGLGTFPNNSSRPNMVFARVFNSDKLLINQFFKIEKILETYGFEKEKRKFFPHISLIRVKNTNEGEFMNTFNPRKEMSFGTMTSFKTHLIESKLTNTGPIYTTIE